MSHKVFDIERYLLENTIAKTGDEFLKKYVVDYELYEELMNGIPIPDGEIFESFKKRLLREVKSYVRRI